MARNSASRVQSRKAFSGGPLGSQPLATQPLATQPLATQPFQPIGSVPLLDSKAQQIAPAVQFPQIAIERQAQEFKQRIYFVDLTYKSCLGRAPESEGLIYWSNLIASRQATFDQVQSGICSSPEGKIANIYVNILGRYPDPSGREFWLSQLTSGRLTIQQISDSIAASDERKAIDLQQRVEKLKLQIDAVESERRSVLQRLQST